MTTKKGDHHGRHDPKEQLVGVFMSQAPSTRIASRMLYKDLVYGAVVK